MKSTQEKIMWVAGKWSLNQSNGPVVDLDLEQQEFFDAVGERTFSDRVTGGARYGDPAVSGLVKDGRSNGLNFSFQVEWQDGKTGQYQGGLDVQRRYVGLTYNVANPGEQASFVSSRTF